MRAGSNCLSFFFEQKLFFCRVKTNQPEYQELNDNDVLLENRLPRRIEPTMEAEVLEGETLASLAIRFNVSVADVKRLNKIDKDNEIFARKTLRIPITPHNILLDTSSLPSVHKSGTNSPKHMPQSQNGATALDPQLNEKLIVASVANSEYVNDVILNSRVTLQAYTDDVTADEQPQPTVILAKPRMDFSFNGSDCDMNWVCLFFCILALCFAIPLIYV